MEFFNTIFALLLFKFVICSRSELDDVTMGSTVKLMNKAYGVRLHSHDIKYGSGSGQQSVTGMNNEVDANSYWQIRSPTNEAVMRGTPIKCGQNVRLTHIRTMANLHSHHVSSPLSNEQEVSCYGEDGEGDHLDNWEVICSGAFWRRDQFVRFKHVETGAFLGCSGRTYGRPIHGQYEVVGSFGDSNRSQKQWRAMEGVFVKPSENLSTQ